jgi:hypothetical protein
MTDLQEQLREYNARKREQYRVVMQGDRLPPPCFTCKWPSTHVSETITPAGYHSWQCDRHARSQTAAGLWGSDPGSPTVYVTVEEASARYLEDDHARD